MSDSTEPKEPVGWRIGVVNHVHVRDVNAPFEYYLRESYKTLEDAQRRVDAWNRAEHEEEGIFADVAVVEPVFEEEPQTDD